MSYDTSIISPLATPPRSSKAYSPDDSDAAWTAARCDTLIETLQSRIALLKAAAHFLPPSTVPKQADDPSIIIRSPDILRRKRRSQTTYAKRTRRGKDEINGGAPGNPTSGITAPDAPSRAPGEAWGATPFLSRTVKMSDMSLLASNASAKSNAEEQSIQPNDDLRSPVFQPGRSRYQLKQVLKQAQSTVSMEQYDMSMRLCESYQALLCATKKTPGPQSKLSNSLLSMCLRAMPARMDLEQALHDFEAKAADLKLFTAPRTLSSEMYSEVREMDLSGDGGTHIKTILRAHGTAIIRNAIKDRVLCLELGTLAVSNCIQMGCIKESESLVETISRMIEETAPTSFYSQPSSAFSFMLSCTRSAGAYFGMLTSMFSSSRIPIFWLATKHFQSMWPKLYAALSGESGYAAAERFCNVILPLLSTALKRSMDGVGVLTTFVSLISNLCAIVMMGTRRLDSCNKESRVSIINVLQYFAIDLSGSEDYQQVCIGVFITLLLRPLDSAPQTIKLPDVLATLDAGGLDHCKPVAGILSSVTCSILDRCERVESGDGGRMAKQLIGRMGAVPASAPCVLHVLWAAMLNGIWAFAQHLPNGPIVAEVKDIVQTLRFRLGLSTAEEEILSSPNEQRGSKTPEVRDTMKHIGDCRWEEGIGEWVAMTPGSATAQEAGRPSLITEYGDSPFVPYQRRGRAKRAATASRSASFLDLVPSSPDGSDREAESSFLTEMSTHPDRSSSPREDHGFRDRPKKFRKLDVLFCRSSQHGRDAASMLEDGNSNNGEGVRDACVENPFAGAKIENSIRLRTPFPPSGKQREVGKTSEGSMHAAESSGDELGW